MCLILIFRVFEHSSKCSHRAKLAMTTANSVNNPIISANVAKQRVFFDALRAFVISPFLKCS